MAGDVSPVAMFYLLQVSFPVSTWLLFKVEEESLERRKLLCGILAQEFLSDDGNGDADGEKNHEPGSVKCIKSNTTPKLCFFLVQVANLRLCNLKRSLCSISFRPDTWCKWLTWLPIMSATSRAPSSSYTRMALSGHSPFSSISS